MSRSGSGSSRGGSGAALVAEAASTATPPPPPPKQQRSPTPKKATGPLATYLNAGVLDGDRRGVNGAGGAYAATATVLLVQQDRDGPVKGVVHPLGRRCAGR